jgi:hypothetical protein
MNTIVVLIYFTEGSRSALLQGAELAKKVDAKVVGLHIVNSFDKIVEAEKLLNHFMEHNLKDSVNFEALVSEGSLNSAVRSALKKLSPDLVLVCTHGIKGIAQHLFGAQILKLVQEINFPCIVVQENCAMDLINIDTILFPIGPHPDFTVKIKQTAALAKILNAKIVIYEIERPNIDFEDILNKNIVAAKEYFSQQNINYSVVIEDNKIIALGYFRQTMEYAKENKIYLISQMASVSNNDVVFGVGDKEKFFVNANGLSILSCN